jgi:Type IIA topoisomerase (DNA gyrase/topo II, topoisomerase IV), A subunit
MNFLPLALEEKVTSILPVPKGAALDASSVVFVTEAGVVKRVAAKAFADVRRSGIIAINLKDGDKLVSANHATEEDTVSLVTAKGQSIRFAVEDVREMGRTAGGVKGMSVRKGDRVVSAEVISELHAKDASLLVIMSKGYGKRTKISEYKIQGRGGSGVKTAAVTPKTGEIIGAKIVVGDLKEEELVVISKKGQVIRTSVAEISLLSRATQGVRVMRLYEGDSIASMAAL